MADSGEILNKLFGSPNRVKILRIFILNPDKFFSLKELGPKLKLRLNALRKEISIFSKIDFIKTVKKEKKEKFFLNSSFLFLKPLKGLIMAAAPVPKDELLEKLKKAGRFKLVVLSGSLIEEENDSRIDMLVISDSLNKSSLTKLLKGLEANAGRDISYVVMPVKEFQYRLDIRDKFVREILESPHEVVLDKLKIF